MKITRSAVTSVVLAMLECPKIKTATKYLDESTVVVGTRMHKHDARTKSTTLVLTVGKPNYRCREFIRLCRKSGEPFPVKKLQLRWSK